MYVNMYVLSYYLIILLTYHLSILHPVFIPSIILSSYYLTSSYLPREGKDPSFYLVQGAEVPTVEGLAVLKALSKDEAFGIWKERHSQHCYEVSVCLCVYIIPHHTTPYHEYTNNDPQHALHLPYSMTCSTTSALTSAPGTAHARSYTQTPPSWLMMPRCSDRRMARVRVI